MSVSVTIGLLERLKSGWHISGIGFTKIKMEVISLLFTEA
jgi:hypothetical protein